MIRNEATLRQIEAAIPRNSTWLSANAGSGKTRVLTDRVARLLLEDVLPEHILCLTFTKAAASEMQNRLFKRLGEWAMLEDAELRDALLDLGVEADLSGDFLRNARTLFARAIETPGGLRIQTIHSFCSSLLRRFPLEARVSPQFQEIEDRTAEILRDEILNRMAEGPEAGWVADMAALDTSVDLSGMLAEIVGNRRAFEGVSEDDLRKRYGLGEDGDSIERILSYVFPEGEVEFIADLVPLLNGSGSNDQKAGAKLLGLKADLAGLLALEDVGLFGGKAKDPYGPKVGAFPTKALRNKHMAGMTGRMDDLLIRVASARLRRIAVSAFRGDSVLFRFAQAFLPLYEAEKLRRGWLDFDDLIEKAHELLSDRDVAEWVLYRLDGGIDHILVDEAQDTSPVQWQVVQRLAQEFTSGEGARADKVRTIFVVGDKKQSIYSFQGADPDEFDRMQADFADRLEPTGEPLHRLSLAYSFRSAEPILRVVDKTFEGLQRAGFVPEETHKAFKEQMPGRVDLWPLIDKTKLDNDDDWWNPVDLVGDHHHTVLLARRVAAFIRQTIDSGHPMPVENGHSGTYAARPVQAGDFLILVRSRGTLYSEIMRACKQAGLPMAGADRLKVMSELAVRDLAALLSFLATPEDSYSLAVALRSPLFGLEEQALFDLSHRREGPFLWEALRKRRDDFPHVMAVLDDLMGQTDFLRPYDLIDRILIQHDGRKRLLGRLGEEAEDGINAFLQQAIAYEQTSVPSLTGFLQWMETDDLEIKRQMESAGDKVRMMTVHGSKGLEAPIVILPDTAQKQDRRRGSLLKTEGSVLWAASGDDASEAQEQANQARRDAEQQELARLLYVGMTRAEKWLVVGAYDDLGKQGDSWYEMVQRGMLASGATEHLMQFGPEGQGKGLRLDNGLWDGLEMTVPEVPDVRRVDVPDFLHHAIPDMPPHAEPLTPSNLGGAKALPGADGDLGDIAMHRGTMVHGLLETLPDVPVADWPDTALAILRQLDPTVQPEALAPWLAEAEQVLTAPSLARYFAGDTLAEVPVVGPVGPLGPMHAILDRVILESGRVTVVDFKTNRTVPGRPEDCPEGILRQMGAYAVILSQIYPGHVIETGVIWTTTATYMELPHDLVMAAVERAYLDLAPAAP
ncbi:double-strand break repair helicase AddA [Pseudoprimorskyibacter insulae]|uniref:DNA 3'-5' helicase n=1 Tax=Pseudoprimorskyibacter insulae TaxID=1695997 RepID=A0A2R8AU19_9RHOB|nr:double-strand break repair helicase AddA [Pseudoprimorskyibacter insulae]SPF79535.1 ATP-dependent helicase/nuclease subunit A [Pseudoprimorskyibacter insulae]